MPYGFDLVSHASTLNPNEAEQAVIADIQAMRKRGMKLVKIADALTEQGVPTKTGKSRRWTHQAVARILNRKVPVIRHPRSESLRSYLATEVYSSTGQQTK